MNTEQAIIVSALETFDDYINKYLDQTKDSVRIFSDDEELRAHFTLEFANRTFLRNYVRDLIENINQSGYAITDSTTPDNKRLLETLEGF